MKIFYAKPPAAALAVATLLKTTPTIFLKAVGKSTFKEGHPNFDLRIYKQVVKSIMAGTVLSAPVTINLSPAGIPVLNNRSGGISSYVAVAAKGLGIETLLVYALTVDPSGNLVRAKATSFPPGFEIGSNRVAPVTDWSAYSWYKLKPSHGKTVKVVDIKGEKFDLEVGTTFGTLGVKAGVRVVDGDDTSVYFILRDKDISKLLANSIKLKTCPVGIVAQAKPVVKKIVITPEPEQLMPLNIPGYVKRLPTPEPLEEDDMGFEIPDSRIVDVDSLDDIDDIDDLSKDLYGHHVDQFDEDMDSLSMSQLSAEQYLAFLSQHPNNQDMDNPEVADEQMLTIVPQLYNYLKGLGYTVELKKCQGYRGNVGRCSQGIRSLPEDQAHSAVVHYVVTDGTLVFDPCYKRLDSAVTEPTYAFSTLLLRWDSVVTVDSPSLVTGQGPDALQRTVPGTETQSPTPVVETRGDLPAATTINRACNET